jgi:replicative DNA helicase
MTSAAIAGRILTQKGQIAASAFRAGDLSPQEWDRAHEWADRLRRLPIIVDDQACTLGAIRRLVRRHEPDLVVIDYLQLLQGPRASGGQDERSEKRHEIDAISRGLKRLAKRHRCVVMSLSQLTLIPDGKGKFQRPTGASLKESRGPSQDADTIFLLWRPDPETHDVELIVAKGRNHSSGSVRLQFTPTYLWFREPPA